MTVVTCVCGSGFQAAAHLAGQTVACPSCGRPLHIPHASPIGYGANALRGEPHGYAVAPRPGSYSPGQQPAFPHSATNEPSFPIVWIVAVGIGALALLVLAIGASLAWRGLSERVASKGKEASVESKVSGPPISGKSSGTPPVPRPPADGEPFTAPGLEAFYRLPPGASDCTELWRSAMQCATTSEYQQHAKDLPIVGDAPIPFPGEIWSGCLKAREFLDRFQEPLRLAHQASERGGAARYPTRFADGFFMDMREVQHLRSFAKLLLLEARVCAYEGNASQAARALRACLSAAHSLDGYPASIAGLVRSAIAREGESELLAVLPHVAFDDADLLVLQEEIERLSGAQNLKTLMIGERVLGLNGFADPAATLKFVFEDGGLTGKPETVDGLTMTGMIRQANAGRVADEADYRDVMGRAVEAAGLPLHAAMPGLKTIQEKHLQAEKQKSPIERNVISLLLASALYPPALDCGTTEAFHQITRTALAIQRFQRTTGMVPGKLTELTPKYLARVPQDPFDGQPLRFRRDGEQIVIYSVGENGRDDRGTGDQNDLTDIVKRVSLVASRTKPAVIPSAAGQKPQPADRSTGKAETSTSIDLLAAIGSPPDPKLLRGMWSVRNGVLVSRQQDSAAYLIVPHEVPRAYRVTAEVAVDGGEGSFNLTIIVDGRPVMVVLDGWGTYHSGLNLVNGQTGNSNATTFSGQVLRPGETNRVVVTVQPHSVTVEVNDRKIIRWAGDAKELSVDRRFWPDSRGRMFLGSWQTTFRVSKLTLMPVPEQ